MKADNGREVKRRYYFMTDEEAKILWQYSGRWSTKFQVMLGFALWRGERISEIVAKNIYDFQDDNFELVRSRLAKSNIVDNFPILKQFAPMIQDYIQYNKHTFKDGYFFPFYSSRAKAPHMTSQTAIALFAKLRKIIGKDYPNFLESFDFECKNGKVQKRYRIAWHSCRRWFETKLDDSGCKQSEIQHIMRYKDQKTVATYLDPYRVWKREPEILNKSFGSLFQEFSNFEKGQTKLSEY